MVEQYDKSTKADVRKATTCDLCTSLGPNHEPSCVYACPHDAAHRMKGERACLRPGASLTETAASPA